MGEENQMGRRQPSLPTLSPNLFPAINATAHPKLWRRLTPPSGILTPARILSGNLGNYRPYFTCLKP